MPADPAVVVFGPAYLDRVLRVDRPLLDPSLGQPPLDRSVDGRRVAAGPADALRLVDPAGATLVLDPPDGWPGPVGTIALARPLADGMPPGPAPRHARGVAWADDLGGMGAGFAAALGGTLVSALGAADDPMTRVVASLLARQRIAHEPVRIADRPADWTLLVTSGAHGDKLPVGFRGCHAAWADPGPRADRPARARVVAGLMNPLARRALGDPTPGAIRAFFPAARNMLDRDAPAATLADRVDLLSCNRGEWADLGAQAAAFDAVPVLAITDGADGATVRFRPPGGTFAEVAVPAFALPDPIVDTNRAGEAFAAALLRALVDAGWVPGPADPGLIRRAAWRASAAAALTLRRADFGFPTDAEVAAALSRRDGPGAAG